MPPWGAGAYDVTLLGGGRLGGRPVVRFSMFEPTTPAWYTVTLDRATLRTLTVSMTAAAHFMRDRYVAFNAPRRIGRRSARESSRKPCRVRSYQSARVSATAAASR